MAMFRVRGLWCLQMRSILNCFVNDAWLRMRLGRGSFAYLRMRVSNVAESRVLHMIASRIDQAPGARGWDWNGGVLTIHGALFHFFEVLDKGPLWRLKKLSC